MPAKRHNQYSNDPWLEIRISVERPECAHRPSDASLALLNRCRDHAKDDLIHTFHIARSRKSKGQNQLDVTIAKMRRFSEDLI